MKFCWFFVIVLLFICSQNAEANRTDAIKSKINCGINSIFKLMDKITPKNGDVAIEKYKDIIVVLNDFNSTVILCINEFLEKHPVEELSAFLKLLKASIDQSAINLPTIHIPEVDLLSSQFYNNFSQIANRSLTCRLNAFVEKLNVSDKTARGCYVSKYQRNSEVLMKTLRKMYRQISQEPLNYFLILVQDIKDKLLKWTVDLCDGLKRCSNSTNVQCCVQEFLWANGSVILSDTDVTGRISKSILTVIADFKEGPANVISTISVNYERFDQESVCCEVY